MKSEYGLAKGKLLLSAPFLHDIFKRSVILLTEHNEEGSVGFILNKPTEYKLHEIIDDFPEFDAKVFLGGPVQQDSVNIIHKAGNILTGGHQIADGVYWGGDFEMLKILIAGNELDPADFKFFLGYSGWSSGQLLNEMKQTSWYVNKFSAANVFSNNHETLWNDILRSKGKEFSILTTFPDDPSVN